MFAFKGNLLQYLAVHVTWAAVLALLNIRARCSFVSVKFAAMARLHVDRNMPMVMQMPTGRSETTDHVLHCKLLIENIIHV